jgi:uncharacterized repeat protein (TIGR03803 family)
VSWISARHKGRRILTAGLFFIASASVDFSIVYRFPTDATRADSSGLIPSGPLTSGAGNLYATTCRRGADGEGSILSIDATSGATTLHTFDNGVCPIHPVVEDDDGAHYGVARRGGTSTAAFVYKVEPRERLTVLASFDNYQAGGNPVTALTVTKDGALYGAAGGSGNAGSVFRIDKAGELAVLYAFPANGTTGADPAGPLVEAADGNFYGTMSAGGAFQAGTVYRVTPDGEGTVVHSFNPNGEGWKPAGGLVVGADSAFYGTTLGSPTSGAGGTIFRVSMDGKFSVLHEFARDEGADPIGELTQASTGSLLNDGYLYGVNRTGGVFSRGTVYRVNARSGRVTVLHAFGSGDDKSSPTTGVIQGPDSALYGIASDSAGLSGIVFRLRLDKADQK